MDGERGEEEGKAKDKEEGGSTVKDMEEAGRRGSSVSSFKGLSSHLLFRCFFTSYLLSMACVALTIGAETEVTGSE